MSEGALQSAWFSDKGHSFTGMWKATSAFSRFPHFKIFPGISWFCLKGKKSSPAVGGTRLDESTVTKPNSDYSRVSVSRDCRKWGTGCTSVHNSILWTTATRKPRLQRENRYIFKLYLYDFSFVNESSFTTVQPHPSTYRAAIQQYSWSLVPKQKP